MYTGTRGPLEQYLLDSLVRTLAAIARPIIWYNRFLERIGLYNPNREMHGKTVSQLVGMCRAGHGAGDAAVEEFRRRGEQARDELIQIIAGVRVSRTSRVDRPTSVSGRTLAIAKVLAWHFPSEESYRAIDALRRRITDCDTQEILVQHLADNRAKMRGQLTTTQLREWIKMPYPASRLAHAEMRLANADPEHRVYLLQSLPPIALSAGDSSRAESYARELLATPDLAEKSGAAVFCANYALGLMAFQRDQLDRARHYLLEASKAKGSARLCGHGPDMDLAQDLLSRGERDIVLEFLENCRSFWTSENGIIDRWRDTILSGGIPDFRCRS
jgi:hypothetical protein